VRNCLHQNLGLLEVVLYEAIDLSTRGGQSAPVMATTTADGAVSVGTLDSVTNLLPFQKHIIHSLIPGPEQEATSSPDDSSDPDVLLILARGLGLRTIIASTLRLYDGPSHLVVLVNATAEEEKGLGEELTTMGVRKPGLRSIGYGTNAKARQELYLSGGLLSVTSQILVTDMLTKKIPTDIITGLIFLHAERITPTCVESFIARIYRQENKEGFLKAFSDSPEYFAMGLSPLQTVLGQLRIRRVELWPRFHKAVLRDLGKRKADVIELHQPLSNSMKRIQNAIVECLEATLGELKRGSGSIEIEDATIENAIFQAFESVVRRQLDPVWHRIGPKTKRLVADLHDLRMLLTYLIAYDAVKFHKYLETILASQSNAGSGGMAAALRQNQSPWLFMDAANVIFSEAKARVFIGDVKKNVPPAASTAQNADGIDADEEEAAFGPSAARQSRKGPWWLPPGIVPTLEELPKWHLLREVLDEIEQDIHFSNNDLTKKPNNTVLIMVESERTCFQIRDFLSTMSTSILGANAVKDANPGRKVMERQLKDYFIWKTDLGNMGTNLRTGAANGQQGQNGQATPQSKQQANFESDQLKRKDHLNKRRRLRGGAASAGGLSRKNPQSAPENLEVEAGEVASFMKNAIEQSLDDDVGPDGEEDVDARSKAADHFTQDEFDSFFGLLSMEDLIVVRPYSGDDDDYNLQELRPRFIIMYDPEPSFVRRVETYRSNHPTLDVRVYFLMYAESVEEQRYLSNLRREKESFERLIREKAMMALPLQADGRPAEQNADERLLRTINSRLAGGQRTATSEPPRVVVDMREFRSSLPSMLHGAGMQVIPCTLQVGDYILTSTMCVERKSLSDLVQSLNSGRLYTQCELMSIHYQHPILLIEFDQGKSFSLQSINQAKANPKTVITAQSKPSEIDIQAKLVLLTTAFPRLRVIWSSSPYATSDIFAELKQNYDEPDVSRVAAIGMDENESSSSTSFISENSYNLTPQDILLSLPGINAKNYRLISNSVRDLNELCEWSKDEINHLIGNEAGNALFDFTHKNVRSGSISAQRRR
jgi:DNA excision repair protein ERCC-4